MNGGSGSALILQTLLFGGVAFSWAYLAGLITAAVLLVRSRDTDLRRKAAWTAVAQFVPFLVTVSVIPLIFVELAINAALPNALATVIALAALAVGPVALVSLVVSAVRKTRSATA